jgi:hypothetical protein
MQMITWSMKNRAWEESKRENTARKPHLELARLKEKEERDEKAGGLRHLYGLVAPESMARQGGAHGPPRQLRSTPYATVAPLVAPSHVARQSDAVATRTGATKMVRFANIFFRLVLKYCLKKD